MHLVIIGNGITGTTLARYFRKKRDDRITIISSETEYFYSRTALMYLYMGHMKYHHIKPYEDWFWGKSNIELITDHVTDIDTDQKQCHLRDGDPVSYDILVVATGSVSRKIGWPGQDLKGVQGLYGMPDVELMEKNTGNIQRAVVVGGGLIGIEMSEMLHTRDIPVTFLVREKNYWNSVLPDEEARIVNREIRRHHIDLRLETELKEILGDESGRVKAVVTSGGDEIPCQFVGLTIGVRPNIEMIKKTKIKTDVGVLVNRFFETNISDVYSAGDCAQFTEVAEGDPAVEQLWYTGRLQGEALARILLGERTPYDRGIWFNSAKFYTIEYQTYGRMPAQIPDDLETFYWEDEEGKKCLRINFRKNDRSVTGFTVLGLRLRQVVCEQWIRENQSLEYVLEHFGEADFDPEIYRQLGPEIIETYNRQHPDQSLQLKRKRQLIGYFQFRNKFSA